MRHNYDLAPHPDVLLLVLQRLIGRYMIFRTAWRSAATLHLGAIHELALMLNREAARRGATRPVRINSFHRHASAP